MSTQDLVPDDFPYGERQNRVSQIRAAGLPTDTSASGQGGTLGASVPPPSSGGVPPGFDALTAVQPSPADQLPMPPDPRSQLLQVAESTQSEVMRVILRRIASKL